MINKVSYSTWLLPINAWQDQEWLASIMVRRVSSNTSPIVWDFGSSSSRKSINSFASSQATRGLCSAESSSPTWTWWTHSLSALMYEPEVWCSRDLHEDLAPLGVEDASVPLGAEELLALLDAKEAKEAVPIPNKASTFLSAPACAAGTKTLGDVTGAVMVGAPQSPPPHHYGWGLSR